MPNNIYLRILVLFIVFLTTYSGAQAKPADTKYLSNVPQYVQYESAPGAFQLAADGSAASITVSGEDWQGVVRAAGDLGQDIGRVTGTAAQVVKADTFSEYTKENLALSPNLKPLPKEERNIMLTGVGQRMRSEVFDNLRWLTARLNVTSGGLHTVKIIMIDPEVVLERIVVNPDNAHPSYFGAPGRQLGK